MREFRAGRDITLISIGGILVEALHAAEMLTKVGIEARVLSCHALKPLDQEAILLAASETGGIVTIEEHSIIGGLGSAVAESCLDQNATPKKYLRIGLNDTYTSIVGDQQYLRKCHGMDAISIFERILKLF
jgi:transketolase